jgi:hypothetical protein
MIRCVRAGSTAAGYGARALDTVVAVGAVGFGGFCAGAQSAVIWFAVVGNVLVVGVLVTRLVMLGMCSLIVFNLLHG